MLALFHESGAIFEANQIAGSVEGLLLASGRGSLERRMCRVALRNGLPLPAMANCGLRTHSLHATLSQMMNTAVSRRSPARASLLFRIRAAVEGTSLALNERVMKMSKTTPTVTAPAHMLFVSTTVAKAVTRPTEPTTIPARVPVEWYVPPHRRQVAGNAGVPFRKRFCTAPQ